MKTTIPFLAAASVASLMFLTACKKQDAQPVVQPNAQPDTQQRAQLTTEPGILPTVGWHSSQTAAADSVEGQLRSQGKHWTKTTAEIKVGAYVQDILEGRLDQPDGRGAIGKVISINTQENGTQAATVNFGRDYSPLISLSELSLVDVASE